MGKMKNRYMLNRKTVQHYLVDHNLTQSEFAENSVSRYRFSTK